MTDRTIFFTRTMARVHAKQGNLEQAAEIYRYLLEKEPQAPDLVSELSSIERRMRDAASDRLAVLFEQWFDLIFTQAKVRRLERMRRSMSRNRRFERNSE